MFIILISYLLMKCKTYLKLPNVWVFTCSLNMWLFQVKMMCVLIELVLRLWKCRVRFRVSLESLAYLTQSNQLTSGMSIGLTIIIILVARVIVATVHIATEHGATDCSVIFASSRHGILIINTWFLGPRTDVSHYNFVAHQLILVIFGRGVAERACYRIMVCYLTSHN